MKSPNRIHITVIFALILCLAFSTSCSRRSAENAAKGGAAGAVIGGIGGLVTALVFGGNVGDAVARGAVWGASTGAVGGAISGASYDQPQNPQPRPDAKMEEMKAKLGEDAYLGLEALARCRHEVALAYARSAVQSDNNDHVLGGVWVEILTYADSRQEAKARQLFPTLVEKDPKIENEQQAEEQMRSAMQWMFDIRKENSMPIVCN